MTHIPNYRRVYKQYLFIFIDVTDFLVTSKSDLGKSMNYPDERDDQAS
jgi:hypothetical protein